MFDAFSTLLITTALLLGSPGPATLALAAVGGSAGFRRGIPFLSGILCGLAVAIAGAGLGLVSLFTLFPATKLVMQLAGGTYILYIAWKIASAPLNSNENDARGSLPKFRDGFILNLLNPKAYAAFVAIFSQLLLPFDSAAKGLFFTALTCFAVATVVDVAWLACGRLIAPVFNHPTTARPIRVGFAAIMLLAVFLSF